MQRWKDLLHSSVRIAVMAKSGCCCPLGDERADLFDSVVYSLLAGAGHVHMLILFLALQLPLQNWFSKGLYTSQVNLTVFQSTYMLWLSVSTDTFIGFSLVEVIYFIILQAFLFVGWMGFAVFKFLHLAGMNGSKNIFNINSWMILIKEGTSSCRSCHKNNLDGTWFCYSRCLEFEKGKTWI